MNTNSETIYELFDIFDSPRRRCLWQYLMDTDEEEHSFEDLVDHLFPEESSADTESEECRRSIEACLHHIDLPKMADVGLVEYDPTSNTVRHSDSTMDDLIERLFRATR